MEENLSGRWIARWTGLGIAAAVLAFFSSAEIAAADPVRLASIGLFIAIAIAVDHHAATNPGDKYLRIWHGVTLVSFIGGAFILQMTAREAEATLSANKARCLAIQRDMLSAHPRRSDGPDLFQALGCRPQGEGGVSAAPTDRERKAGHPLPSGGYPPSR